MSLTDVQIRNAKPTAKGKKLTDANGLYLYVAPSGTKSWRYDYEFAEKRKTFTFGTYPSLTLADARTRRDAAKRQLAAGTDPSLARKREQLESKAAAGNTFGVIATEFLDKMQRDKRAAPTIAKNRWMLETLAAKLGPFPVTQITPKDVLSVLRVNRQAILTPYRRVILPP